jgi:lysine-N-methylase
MGAKEIEILRPVFCREFSCIGPACTDNCCHTWRIDVDKKHYFQYRNVRDPEFHALCATTLRRKKKDATEECFAILAHPADGKCSFQDEDGGCRIYRLLGQGSLCTTCTIYPRRRAQFLPGLQEFSLSLSCEEVVRLALFSGGPVKFERVTEALDEEDPFLLTPAITVQGRGFAPPPPFGQPLRQACLDLMADQTWTPKERIMAIGLLLRRADQLIQEKKQDQIPAVAQRFHQSLREQPETLAQLFQRPAYSREAHAGALRMPMAHLLAAGRKPLYQGLLDRLTAFCQWDAPNNTYHIGLTALDQLIRETEAKADPILRDNAQAVENYFTCYLFSDMFPIFLLYRGFTLEQEAVLLAQQYALLRILLAALPEEEGEDAQRRLTRGVVALARITQHSNIGKTFHSLAKVSGLDSLGHAAYLLW